jgi:hypothetical protein
MDAKSICGLVVLVSQISDVLTMKNQFFCLTTTTTHLLRSIIIGEHFGKRNNEKGDVIRLIGNIQELIVL